MKRLTRNDKPSNVYATAMTDIEILSSMLTAELQKMQPDCRNANWTEAETALSIRNRLCDLVASLRNTRHTKNTSEEAIHAQIEKEVENFAD